MAILLIGLVQTAKSACPNYGKVYGYCESDLKALVTYQVGKGVQNYVKVNKLV